MPECPSAPRVPECPLSALRVPKYPSAFRVSSMFECPLSVFTCTSQAWMSNQKWLERNAKHKNMFHVKKKKCKKKNGREEFRKLNIILKHIRALIWKAFEIDFEYLIYVKIFVKFTFCVGTFTRNFRPALMILIFTLNKKRSYEMYFKQMIRNF